MIEFVNIRSGEKVAFTADMDPVARQAHMAAYLNSSNLSPNALRGQDFGWRLAPEIVAEMERIRTDARIMTQLAQDVGTSIDEIRDYHILDYIASQRFAAEAMRLAQQNKSGYEEEYERQLKELRTGNEPISNESDSKTDDGSAKLEALKTSKKES